MLRIAGASKHVLVVFTVFTTCFVLFLLGRHDGNLVSPSPRLSRVARLATGRKGGRGLLDSVHNSTLGFEKVFVVGLPSRSDRRDGMALTAALSDVQIEFMDGVLGSNVNIKAVPKHKTLDHIKDAELGSWRGHINAIREVVMRNLSSVLILEDDVDWDIRLKDQLHDLALSTNALLQPLRGFPDRHADATYPKRRQDESPPPEDIPFEDLPVTIPPKSSPYGDNWDVLWIGHCGMIFPREKNDIPKGRVIHRDDVTVAPKRNLWLLTEPFTLKEKYPPHTRAVHHAEEGVCTLAYAISQAGARKILHELALKPPTAAFDILLRFFCDGTDGRAMHNCLGVTPGLFHHYRPAGKALDVSDIRDHDGDFREDAGSDIVRWSVRLNTPELLDGGTSFADQYPD
ncbi:hypothetical protein DCS_06986 [Drechmeria coniospora]|uniref:Glycosyl transferase family 25 domain-containing protein n=1 Tax=Drechmeria coniospora TaxID=98403 RepID=A0A151GD79_DRECN|nr:hypothetical protein DCS_06986 [Drechmeria coniospora]KYK55025.1 hypothetical protein DCS_06986 [Drechmeria coniospora]ODA82346.1 hypothetical protein RJ55_00853 [Drechmeria coniospora]